MYNNEQSGNRKKNDQKHANSQRINALFFLKQ